MTTENDTPDIDDLDDIDEAADRGDDLGDAGDEGSDDTPRDDRGRFAKKGDADADADADDDADADADAGADADADDDADDDDDDDDAPAGKDDKNLALRLEKMRTQRDAAREEAAAARAAAEKGAGGKPAPKPDPTAEIEAKLDGLYEQVEEARLDGDVKLAASLQRQIDAANRDMVKLEAERIAAKTTTAASENARYNALLDAVEADVSQLDAKSDDFDPTAVKALEFHVEAYEKMGMAADKALQHAAAVLFGFGAKKPAPAGDDKVVPLKKKPDVKKAVDAMKRQPADMSKRGVAAGDDTEVDVDRLDDEEMDKIPLSKLRQMRGDNG